MAFASIPTPFGGSPGPPQHAFNAVQEDDSDLLMVDDDGPDDLGDLMLEIREGGPWAESLAMDCDTAMAAQEPPPQPRARSPAPANGGAQASTPAPEDPMGQLLAMQQRQASDAAAERAGAAMQPGVRALLMHPPGAGAPPGGLAGAGMMLNHQRAMMVPVALGLPPAADGAGEGEGEVPPPSLPAFWGAPQGRGGQPGPGQYGGPPPPGPPPFGQYFRLPPGVMQAPPPCSLFAQYNALPAFGAALPPQPSAAAMLQQGSNGGAGTGGPCGSASAASGGTALRGSFESVASQPTPGRGYSYSRARLPVQFGGAVALPPPPASMSSAAALTAFEMATAAYDVAAAAVGAEPLFPHRQPAGPYPVSDYTGTCATGGTYRTCGECPGASDDSSDVEDGGGRSPLERQYSQTQVVPDAPHAFGLLPLPLPPHYCPSYESPAVRAAHAARAACLERFRAKKARRAVAVAAHPGRKLIRYQARKDNADKRPRVKGRFVKAGAEPCPTAGTEASTDTAAAAPSSADAVPWPAAALTAAGAGLWPNDTASS